MPACVAWSSSSRDRDTAHEIGYTLVSTSQGTGPMMKLMSRGVTAMEDASALVTIALKR